MPKNNLTKSHTESSLYLKEAKAQLRIFMRMNAGEKILRPNLPVLITTGAQFTRKSLKHFAESRLKHDNSRKEIFYLIERAAEVLVKPQLHISNPNKRYPDSSLLGRFYTDSNKAVIVILDKDKTIRNIISLHFKNKKDFYRLLKTLEKSAVSVGGGAAYPS